MQFKASRFLRPRALSRAGVLLLPGSAMANDSCQYANDGQCDVPGACPSDTDSSDCDGLGAITAQSDPLEGWFGHVGLVDGLLLVGLLAAAAVVYARRLGAPRSGWFAAALVLLAIGLVGWMLLPAELLMPLHQWSDALGMASVRTPFLLAAIATFAWALWRNLMAPAPGALGRAGDDALMRAALSPDIRESEDNEISAARRMCADAAAYIEQQLRASSDRFHVYAQYDAASQPWLQVDRLASNSRGAFVASLRMVFEPQPFSTVPVLVHIEVDDRGRRRRVPAAIEVGHAQLDALVKCLEGQGPRFEWKGARLRRWPWQLWRPRQLSAVLERPFSASMRANVRMLLWFGAGLVLLWLWTLSPLGVTVAAAIGVWAWRRLVVPDPVYRVTGSCPPRPPRILRGLDSWQAVVRDLGVQREAIVDRLETILRERMGDTDEPVNVRRENIWYEGAEGKVERQQLTVGLRRAIVFIRIYRYGADLFVGWDAHVNLMSWAEKRLETGHRAADGVKVQLVGVQTQVHPVNEYDITDANFLLEATHVHLSRLLKQVLREQEIDQVLDFTIVRESRQTLVGTAAQEAGRRRGFSRA